MQKKITLFFSLIAITLFQFSCQKKEEKKTNVIFYDFESDSVATSWIALNTRIKTDSYSGQWCTTVNQSAQYGGGYANYFPDSLQGRNIAMDLSAWVKAKDIQTNVNIAISLSIGDSVIFWNSVEIKKVLKESERWENIKHQINFPASHTGKEVTFKLFLWSADGKSEGYMDDISISFSEMNMISYLPKIENWKVSTSAIFPDAKLYIEYGNLNDSIVTNEIVDLEKIKLNDTMSTYNFTSKKLHGKIDWLVEGKKEVSFKSQIVFNSQVEIKRISLVIPLSNNPTEYYLAGGILQNTIQNEVWLDRGGIKNSYGSNSLLIYHQTEVSSMQYIESNKQLFINLDYSADHPQVNAPLLSNGKKGVFENWSSSIYNKGEILNSSFRYYVGEDPGNIPRILNNQNGYEATYIWTEHADYGDIRTHKAVCFGNENISTAAGAVGGFCKFKIPVTKSVFYSNPDMHNNSVNDPRFVTPVANLKQTPGFQSFLSELKSAGFEICLHTPDQFTAESALVKEAVLFFKNNFGSSTWIDHGYDNGAGDNREDFACDGLKKNSSFYMKDIWEDNDVKYFWNSYQEDIPSINATGFENHLQYPFYGYGGSTPTPILFQNPSRSGNLYSWVSNSLIDYDNSSWWSYYYNEKTLNELIKSHGIIINHCYPARVNDHNAFWIFEEGKIKSNPEFDKALALLASYRDKGLLNITTIPEFANYNLAINKTEIRVITKGNFEVINKSGKTINGFSMIVKGNDVEVLGQQIQKKRIKDEIIFWFDLNSSAHIIIK